jgi:hypothetical protein
MDDDSWLQLTAREHAILLEAVRSMLDAGPANSAEVENLAVKLAQAHPLSRAMENCPLSATRNCPLLG